MSSEQIEVVYAAVASFRNRDLETFGKCLHEDFRWVDDQGQFIGDRKFLLDSISQMWADSPNVHNESTECVQIGNLVTHGETFSGYPDGHVDKCLWVYEFAGNEIIKMIGILPTA